MSFLTGWLTVFRVGLIAVVPPGPDFALTLRNSLAYSRRAGVYTAFGIGLGNTIHATYSLVGIGALISQSIMLFNLIKLVGAGYLIYIGTGPIGFATVDSADANGSFPLVRAVDGSGFDFVGAKVGSGEAIGTGKEPDRELFLAVQQQTFVDVFEEALGELVLTRKLLKLLIFDAVKQAVVKWIA